MSRRHPVAADKALVELAVEVPLCGAELRGLAEQRGRGEAFRDLMGSP